MIKALAAAVLLLVCVACGPGGSAPLDQPEPAPRPVPTPKPGPRPEGEICELRVSDESTNQEIALEFNRLRRECGWTEEQAEAAALML
jgi:hypothetical protein